jgi:hypothetical protein
MNRDEIRRRADENDFTLGNKSCSAHSGSGQGQNGDRQFLGLNFRGFKPVKIMESS